MTGQESRPRIVIIGTGATGRGQIGQLAHSAGFAITFIDRKPELVEILRSAGRYTVGLAGESVREIEVTGFEVLHKDEVDACSRAIARADIIATAVIPTNLQSTSATFAAGLAMRKAQGVEKTLNVIACENMERSSSTLRGYLKESAPDLDWKWIDAHVGFPDSMIARAVPVPSDPLFLLSEADQEWTVDVKAVRQPMPRLEGMTLVEDQESALERKLYIKNTGHYAIGLLGYLKRYRLMHESTNDPGVFARVDAVTRESATAVIAKHGFLNAEIDTYRSRFLEQMKSPFLPDEIERVIREPIRKLAREERLVGPAMLSCEQGRFPESLAYVISAALAIVNPRDPQAVELQSRLESESVESVVEQVCGIPPDHILAAAICRMYREMAER